MVGKHNDIRVMVVDDSAVIRGLTTRWLSEIPSVEIVAVHVNGKTAVDDVATSKPDVIILDIEMPEMDGLTALPLLLQRHPGVVVLVSSTLSRRGAETSLRCLALGAAECIAKPDGSGRVASATDYRRDLVNLVIQLGDKARRRRSARPAVPQVSPATPAAGFASAPHRQVLQSLGRIDTSGRPIPSGSAYAGGVMVRGGQSGLASRRLMHSSPASQAGAAPLLPKRPGENNMALRSFSSVPPRILAFGSSTGGPQALVQVLTACRDALVRVPVLIVQHMPPTFTALLAEQLGRATGLPSAEARDGETIQAGRIYVAPGGLHFVIAKDERLIVARLRDTPPEHFCRPAVDPLFRSVAQVFGAASLGVVLTGMGNDGSVGASAISDGGGSVIIQDEETSVVWGMPGNVKAAGAAAAVLPLGRIGPKLGELLHGRYR